MLLKSLYDLIRIRIHIRLKVLFSSQNGAIFRKGGFLSSTFADRIIASKWKLALQLGTGVIEYADIEKVGENTGILITLIPRATATEGSGRSAPRRNYNEANVETTGKTWWNKGKSRLRLRLGQTELWRRSEDYPTVSVCLYLHLPRRPYVL